MNGQLPELEAKVKDLLDIEKAHLDELRTIGHTSDALNDDAANP